MKYSLKYLIAAVLGISAFSCEKDNYAPPNAMLSGNLLYKGEAINR